MEAKEITPLDVFELLQITAAGINLDEVKSNQKHPDRKRFVNELIQYLKNYHAQPNKDPKPEGYFEALKGVISSKTTELIEIMEACKSDNLEGFAKIVREIDLETLRRMGKLPVEDQPNPDIPMSLRGKTAQHVWEILPALRDARQDAATRRRRMSN